MTKDQKREENRRWRINNPGYHLKQYAIHRDEILERNRQWAEKNREKRIAYFRKYNDTKRVYKLPPKIGDLPKDVADQKRAVKRAYVLKNKEKMSAYWKAYRKAHPEKTKAHNKANWHKRRAKIMGCTVNPESIKLFIFGVKSKPFATCYYCKKRVSTKRVHFDHIVPLSAGGAHSVENLCVSCDGCNQSKHAKLIRDFITLGQQLLAL